MIFCRKCGRYFNEGTPSCGACGADLASFGHASFQGAAVKMAPVADKVARPAYPDKPIKAVATNKSVGAAVADRPVATAVEDWPAPDPPAPSSPNGEIDPVFDRDKFLLRQKALAIKEKYYVADEHGSALLFVERPALLTRQIVMLVGVAAAFVGGNYVMSFAGSLLEPMLGESFSGIFSLVGFVLVLALTAFAFIYLVPKRHVTFYRDDSKRERLLEIRQLNKVEFPYANFSILDATGNVIGSLRKNVLFDYIRRRWQVKNANGLQLCMAKEDSIILSLLRRTGIPIFLFLRTNFIFLRGEEVIGEFNRKLTLRDRYVLDLTADRQRVLDRRIALALGVMLDTGERR